MVTVMSEVAPIVAVIASMGPDVRRDGEGEREPDFSCPSCGLTTSRTNK
jgi:hypothetical protein